jgi:hypothetical protein
LAPENTRHAEFAVVAVIEVTSHSMRTHWLIGIWVVAVAAALPEELLILMQPGLDDAPVLLRTSAGPAVEVDSRPMSRVTAVATVLVGRAVM